MRKKSKAQGRVGRCVQEYSQAVRSLPVGERKDSGKHIDSSWQLTLWHSISVHINVNQTATHLYRQLDFLPCFCVICSHKRIIPLGLLKVVFLASMSEIPLNAFFKHKCKKANLIFNLTYIIL